jgi:hypothetical protein
MRAARWLTLVMLWVFTSLAAGAAPHQNPFKGLRDPSKDRHEVKLLSTPPGARVYDQMRNLIGVTPTTAQLNRYVSIPLTFELDGWSAPPVYTGLDSLPNQPPSKTPALNVIDVKMTPVGLMPAIRWWVVSHPLGAALSLLFVCAIPAGLMWRVKKREQMLQDEIVQAHLEGPVVVGSKIGDYEVVASLGEGSFSQVYRVRHLQHGDEFAMKLLKQDMLANDVTARFAREMELGRDMVHPNLVRVYGFGEHRGAPYLVMELLHGETLAARVERAPMSIEEALSLFTQICAAMHFAHDHNVVHRDLKPENIMLLDDGTLRVMDFGIAKMLNREKLTATGTALGTPLYMSPEHLNSKKLDARSDVYSLGVILYEMLTGRPPFSGDDPMKVISSHLSRKPPSPRAIRPAISPELEALVLRMLEKTPQRRFASVGEVERALRLLQGAAL